MNVMATCLTETGIAPAAVSVSMSIAKEAPPPVVGVVVTPDATAYPDPPNVMLKLVTTPPPLTVSTLYVANTVPPSIVPTSFTAYPAPPLPICIAAVAMPVTGPSITPKGLRPAPVIGSFRSAAVTSASMVSVGTP